MRAITIQIGNTDDRLSQAAWSDFVRVMDEAIRLHSKTVYFFGGSPNWERWQQVAWVVEFHPETIKALRLAVEDTRRSFRQDAAAWTEGETVFI